MRFYLHCFKQLLTNAEDCLDLYKKKCPAKTWPRFFSKRSWSQRIKTKLRRKIDKIFILCENSPNTKPYLSDSCNVSHHIIKLWNKIVNVWQTLKIYPRSFSTKITSNRARTTARQPIDLRACKRCQRKTDQMFFDLEKYSKSLQ